MRNILIAIALTVISVVAVADELKSWCEIHSESAFHALTNSQKLELENRYISFAGQAAIKSINKCKHTYEEKGHY